jgi:hypothetical protein
MIRHCSARDVRLAIVACPLGDVRIARAACAVATHATTSLAAQEWRGNGRKANRGNRHV